jgi:hypothetical protein
LSIGVPNGDTRRRLREQVANGVELLDENFLDDLGPRDVRYTGDDGTHRNKLEFVVGAPDLAPIKLKMMIASPQSAVKKAFRDLALEIKATDSSEIAEAKRLEMCRFLGR